MTARDKEHNLVNLISKVRVRLLDREDLSALEWDGEYVHFRRLYAEVFRRFERGDGVMWVADLSQEGIIGQLFVSLMSNRSELSDGRNRAYVYGFRIRPPYRNKGIGSLMMSVVESDLKNRGYRLVTLNVAQDNRDALRLYKRLGYIVKGYEPGEWSYIDHKGIRQEVIEPAWRMEKKLSCLNKE